MDVVLTVMFGAISSMFVLLLLPLCLFYFDILDSYIYYHLCSMDYLRQLLCLEWIITFHLGVPDLRR